MKKSRERSRWHAVTGSSGYPSLTNPFHVQRRVQHGYGEMGSEQREVNRLLQNNETTEDAYLPAKAESPEDVTKMLGLDGTTTQQIEKFLTEARPQFDLKSQTQRIFLVRAQFVQMLRALPSVDPEQRQQLVKRAIAYWRSKGPTDYGKPPTVRWLRVTKAEPPIILTAPALLKARSTKYKRRWRGKGGRWMYDYGDQYEKPKGGAVEASELSVFKIKGKPNGAKFRFTNPNSEVTRGRGLDEQVVIVEKDHYENVSGFYDFHAEMSLEEMTPRIRETAARMLKESPANKHSNVTIWSRFNPELGMKMAEILHAEILKQGQTKLSKAALEPRGGGWEDIPKGKRGGKRRKSKGGKYEYWYGPGTEKRGRKPKARVDLWGDLNPVQVKQWKSDLKKLDQAMEQLTQRAWIEFAERGKELSTRVGTPQVAYVPAPSAEFQAEFHQLGEAYVHFTENLKRWGQKHVAGNAKQMETLKRIAAKFENIPRATSLFAYGFHDDPDVPNSKPGPSLFHHSDPSLAEARKQYNRKARAALNAANRYILDEAYSNDRRPPQETFVKGQVQFVIHAGGFLPKEQTRIRKVLRHVQDVQQKLDRKGLSKTTEGLTLHVHGEGRFAAEGEEQRKGFVTAGYYNTRSDEVRLFTSGLTEHTLTHELGHRVYFQQMSAEGQEAWDRFYEDRQSQITKTDIDQLLDIMSRHAIPDEDAEKYGTRKGMIDFAEAQHEIQQIEGERAPQLRALVEQMGIAMEAHSDGGRTSEFTIEDWRKGYTNALRNAKTAMGVGETTLNTKVVEETVTPYAETSAKELFAEAFDQYVRKGLGALQPRIRDQFERALRSTGMPLRKAEDNEWGEKLLKSGREGQSCRKDRVQSGQSCPEDPRSQAESTIIPARLVTREDFYTNTVVERLAKSKYTRRWRGSDGKYQYEYDLPQGTTFSQPAEVQSGSGVSTKVHEQAAVLAGAAVEGGKSQARIVGLLQKQFALTVSQARQVARAALGAPKPKKTPVGSSGGFVVPKFLLKANQPGRAYVPVPIQGGSTPRFETPPVPDFQSIYMPPDGGEREKRERKQQETRRQAAAERNRGVYGFHGQEMRMSPLMRWDDTDDPLSGYGVHDPDRRTKPNPRKQPKMIARLKAGSVAYQDAKEDTDSDDWKKRKKRKKKKKQTKLVARQR